MTDNNVIDRLKKYCSLNPDVVKNNIIKGINSSDSTIVIEYNGETKNITIDELESNAWMNTTPIQPVVEEPIEVMEEVVETKAQNNIIINTLKDMNDAVTSKNEGAINQALATFAIDEKTGTVNINKAIKTITNNSTNVVVEAIKNNKKIPEDLSNYDIQGNLITPYIDSTEKVNINELVDQTFKNILVYVEVARLNNVVYNENQIAAAKKKYETGVQDKINVLGLNKQDEIKPDNTGDDSSSESSGADIKDLKPDNDIKKAGFADILILTIIVATYAAIIINLITKLK